MELFTFKGGLHPNDKKQATRNIPISDLKASDIMVYPVSQHIGAPCVPVVSVGDSVLMGQKIADTDAFVSSPIHSTVSGKVVAIEKRRHPNGNMVESIVIENDGNDTLCDSIYDRTDYNSLSREDMIKIIRETGVVGLGGATFPTHIKLNPPPDKKIECVILNGAECEPYLTSDHRVMLEMPEIVVGGLELIMKILGVDKAYIGIEQNKPDAIKVMSDICKNKKGISVKVLKTKYPQGSEKHLIYAITKREVPSGGLPADVGVVVDNVDTCTAVYNAITKRKPIFTRVVTVSGDAVKTHRNFRVRVGTPFKDVFEAAGGFRCEPKKIIMGGPMMGMTQFDLNVPVIKGTSALLAFTDEEASNVKATPCIRCGKCVEKCPMRLMPVFLNEYASAGNIEKCLEYHIMDCIECGVCAYQCQSNLRVVEQIKLMKQKISAQRKKA